MSPLRSYLGLNMLNGDKHLEYFRGSLPAYSVRANKPQAVGNLNQAGGIRMLDLVPTCESESPPSRQSTRARTYSFLRHRMTYH